jgi:hypothetical protein
LTPICEQNSSEESKESSEWSYFDEDLTDEEFLEVVIQKLKETGQSKITYKLFKQYFLPQHRKPNFNDYLRFRRLESRLTDE